MAMFLPDGRRANTLTSGTHKHIALDTARVVLWGAGASLIAHITASTWSLYVANLAAINARDGFIILLVIVVYAFGALCFATELYWSMRDLATDLGIAIERTISLISLIAALFWRT